MPIRQVGLRYDVLDSTLLRAATGGAIELQPSKAVSALQNPFRPYVVGQSGSEAGDLLQSSGWSSPNPPAGLAGGECFLQRD